MSNIGVLGSGTQEVYDDFQLWLEEILGASSHTVCRLRRPSYIVSLHFRESGLFELWLRQLDVLANDRQY
ncbi:MAG: hypothetical protein L0387_05720 [Acidobacteria bacterium]|nr:hypothetical protein [Acidobacteriota bacterium]MCI0722947.1 hypothetical protein [Acidobacteriota bacterium]